MAILDHILDIIADTILNFRDVVDDDAWHKDIDKETIE